MNNFTNWKQITVQSLTAMGKKVMTEIPNILGAILVLFIGWIVTKIVISILKRVIKMVKVEKLSKKINELNLFGDLKFNFKVGDAIIIFAKSILFLLTLIIAADILGWTFVSKEIGNLLRYLPQLFSALLLFFLGIYIAKFLKNAVVGFYNSFGLAGGNIVGNLVFYIIAIIITVTAMNQAGVDTTVVTQNISIILGAFLLSIAIAFGLGAKEIVGDILRTFYARKNFDIGDKIEINGKKGKVEAVDNISLVLKTDDEKLIIPIKDVVTSTIKVKE